MGRNRFVGALNVLFAFFALTAIIGYPDIGGIDSAHADTLPGSDAGNGRAVAKTACAACHGSDGNSPNQQFPKLAGQKAAYLFAQLKAFKDGERTSAVMASIVTGLSDEDMADVSSYFSRQTVRPDRPGDSRLVRVGKRVDLRGTPSAPACAACHSGTGTPMMGRGMMAGRMMGGGMMGGMGGAGSAFVPRLNGQHAAYILSQLQAYASGARRGGVMNQVAAALSPQDARAVAEYLSSQR